MQRGRQGTVALAFIDQVADVASGRFGLHPPDMAAWSERVPLTAYYALLASLQAHASAPVGFEIATLLKATAFEELGFLVRSSQTLRAALDVALRCLRLVTDERLVLEHVGDHVHILYYPSGPEHDGHRPAAELMLGDILGGLPRAEPGVALRFRGPSTWGAGRPHPVSCGVARSCVAAGRFGSRRAHGAAGRGAVADAACGG
ncbi:MAG: AraC family transcriptional regulator ligand-binding domain-containing protein [Nannocystaceae bacterium]|nr:AraC family transcriptional regulator ligand-binding domain-containing protein [Nannocystaceae bacterium]